MAWQYPLQKYVKDLMVWSISTDIDTHQQGPRAMLQLGGRARELIDQVDTRILQHGEMADYNDGRGLSTQSGIEALCNRLHIRFGELETETIIRSLIEYYAFNRLPGEDVDQALTRYDILWQRLVDTGHVYMAPALVAYHLLKGMMIHPSRWPVLFMPWGGRFPVDPQHYEMLKTAVRQQGHLIEPHPNSVNNGPRPTPAAYHHEAYPYHHETYLHNPEHGAPPQSTEPGAGHYRQGHYLQQASPPPEHPAPYSAENYCESCGAEHAFNVYTDPHYDTDPDADDEDRDEHYEVMLNDPNAAENFLESYLIAKKRWRRFTGRPTRRTRFHHRRAKGHGKGQHAGHGSSRPPLAHQRYLCTPCTSYEDSYNETYFGKGNRQKGGGKGKSNKTPIGKDGTIMKCSICVSDHHFRAKCPNAASGKGGPAVANPPTGAMYGNPQAAAALPTSTSTAATPPWMFYMYTDVTVAGAHPNDHDNHNVSHDDDTTDKITDFQKLLPQQYTSVQIGRQLPPIQASVQIEELEDVCSKDWTQAGQDVSLFPIVEMDITRTKNSDAASACAGGQQGQSKTGHLPDVAEDVPMNHAAQRHDQQQHQPAQRREDWRHTQLAQQQNRQLPDGEWHAQDRLEQQLPWSNNHMYMPWDVAGDQDERLMYHTRAHLPREAEALLVDVGARDNLTGDAWVKRQSKLAAAAGRVPTYHSLQEPLNVTGVGKTSQTAIHAVHMPGRLEDGQDLCYSAPVIPDSEIAALWGLKSMQTHHAVVDTRLGNEHAYLGNDIKIVPGPKTKIIKLHYAISAPSTRTRSPRP